MIDQLSTKPIAAPCLCYIMDGFMHLLRGFAGGCYFGVSCINNKSELGGVSASASDCTVGNRVTQARSVDSY